MVSKQESYRGALIGKLHVLLVCGCLLPALHTSPTLPPVSFLEGSSGQPPDLWLCSAGSTGRSERGEERRELVLLDTCCVVTLPWLWSSNITPLHVALSTQAPFCTSQHCFVLLSLRTPDVACGFAPSQAVSLHPAHAFRYFFHYTLST